MDDEDDESEAFRPFLMGLASGMNASAASVETIGETLETVARAYGRDDLDFVVLPTVVLIKTGSGDDDRVAVRSVINATFRFDQIAALYRLIEKAERAEVSPAEGIAQLNEIGAMKPRHGWIVRTLGHALLAAGLSLLLVPTWQGLIVAFLLGALVGLAKLVRSPTLQLVFPVATAFACALAVFLIAPYVAVGDPVQLLIAPLATFLPGAALTTGVVELAAGQVVAGASRLVFGLVQLSLLSFGILAAATLLGVGTSIYIAQDTEVMLPWWTASVGILLFAVGNYLHFSAPSRTFGWVLIVLVVAYVGQFLGGTLIGPSVSGFTGALAMTPVALWIANLRHGAPSQLTFLPAFWLLVPGAAGLVSLTKSIGMHWGTGDFATALISIMSIALGVLIGTALYRFVHNRAEELAVFHIEIPGAVAKEEKDPLWARLVPGTPRSIWRRRERERERENENENEREEPNEP